MRADKRDNNSFVQLTDHLNINNNFGIGTGSAQLEEKRNLRRLRLVTDDCWWARDSVWPWVAQRDWQ